MFVFVDSRSLFNEWIFSDHGTMTTSSATSKTVSLAEQSYSSDDTVENKIIQEFGHLLEKSKQLFNGLRFICRCAFDSHSICLYF
jgi:hypothetical protein